MKNYSLVRLLLLLTFTLSLNFLKVEMSEKNFDDLLVSGSMDGFIKFREFWDIYHKFRNTDMNSMYLSIPISFGKSYQNRQMEGFYICDNTSQLEHYVNSKNIIMFTAVHHPREPLSLTMIVLIIREVLKMLRAKSHNKMKEIFRDNVIFIVPIMNPDSYIYINDNYFSANSKNIRMIRKNRHLTSNCADWTGGVDLNRNYDMKFGMDENGSSSDPCKEDYRGSRPFSEPETASLKNYVDSHPNIVSDVNIHTYGNAWIYPYNYVRDKSNHLLETKNRLFYDWYNEFTHEIKSKDMRPLFGNAAFTLDYATNGEAGDWFTGKKKILNIDIELGNSDPRSEEFYPPKSILADIVRYNWVAMKEYLFKHIVEFSHRIVIYRSQVNFEIVNKSISGLLNAFLDFEPIFTGTVFESAYQMKYCIKDLMADSCGVSNPMKNPLTTTIHGRHVFELQIIFHDAADLHRLEGVKMKIRRPATYLNYQDQHYYFKIAN